MCQAEYVTHTRGEGDYERTCPSVRSCVRQSVTKLDDGKPHGLHTFLTDIPAMTVLMFRYVDQGRGLLTGDAT
jgi:hypothetical protein